MVVASAVWRAADLAEMWVNLSVDVKEPQLVEYWVAHSAAWMEPATVVDWVGLMVVVLVAKKDADLADMWAVSWAVAKEQQMVEK